MRILCFFGIHKDRVEKYQKGIQYEQCQRCKKWRIKHLYKSNKMTKKELILGIIGWGVASILGTIILIVTVVAVFGVCVK